MYMNILKPLFPQETIITSFKADSSFAPVAQVRVSYTWNNHT